MKVTELSRSYIAVIEKHVRLLALLVSFVALFTAIVCKIDGLGIFAIVVGIIFLAYIFYPAGGPSGPNGSVKRQMSNVLEWIRSIPIPVVASLLPSFFPILNENIDRLDKEALLKLEEDLRVVLKKTSARIQSFDSNEPDDPDRNNNRKQQRGMG